MSYTPFYLHFSLRILVFYGFLAYFCIKTVRKLHMANKFEIRNRTADFLIFQIEGKESDVQVVYHKETMWCSQEAMAELFEVKVPAISKDLKNIFESGELSEDSVISKMEATASDGKSYNTTFYNLDAIISIEDLNPN